MYKYDYVNRIINYILEPKFSRALLIDGVWGCGKSYFLKHTLFPKIATTKVGLQDGNDYYIPVYISLFGISSTDKILGEIINSLLDVLIANSTYSKSKNLLEYFEKFGPSVVSMIAKRFNVGEETNDLFTEIQEQFLTSKKKEIVLFFDDFERCRIDTIELMGFINNLCENKGFRVIIVANELEIEKKVDEVAQAVQKQTALMKIYYGSLLDQKTQTNNDNTKHNLSNESESNFKSYLDENVNTLFDRSSLYERSREKLVGFTVHFEPNIENVYDDIASDFDTDNIKHYLLEYKQTIILLFNSYNHNNLRTLITVFIAVGKIISSINPQIPSRILEICDKNSIDIFSIIEEEKENILYYIVTSAITRAEKHESVNWDDQRFGYVYCSRKGSNRVYGYAFVDDYWNTCLANSESINADFINRLNEIVKQNITKNNDKSHYELSLFKLNNWYLEDDKTIKSFIDLMKIELAEKKYYPEDFKGIICTLISLNNQNYGMNIWEEETPNNNNFDEQKSENVYVGWDKVDINEYVDLMLNYFNNEPINIDKEMFSAIALDSNFKKEYLLYISPILSRISEIDNSKLINAQNGNSIFSIDNYDFRSFFMSNKETFLEKNQFISIYGFDVINQVLIEKDVKTIYNLAQGINSIYSFSNLRDYFAADYSVVDRLWISLKKDRLSTREIYNPQKSRTREIALRRFENDLYNYKNNLNN